MNRTIKFRTWYPEAKQMIYGNANRAVVDFEGKVMVIDNISGSYLVPKDFELMQFTGLKDRTGREIYESDIVQENEEIYTRGKVKQTERVGLIFWSNESAGWLAKDNQGWESGIGYPENMKSEMTVIGNIYEQPELLNP